MLLLWLVGQDLRDTFEMLVTVSFGLPKYVRFENVLSVFLEHNDVQKQDCPILDIP